MTINRTTIPAEYQQIDSISHFGNDVGPFYIKNGMSVDEDGVTFLGLKMTKQHEGGPGRGHGGVTMTFLDEVMGRSATHAAGFLCVTITMNTNFCTSTLLDDFLIGQAKVAHRTRKTVFLNASVHAGDTMIATATGVWKSTGAPIPGNFG